MAVDVPLAATADGALPRRVVILTILVFLGVLGQALLARELDRSATREVQVAAAQEVDRLSESGTLTNPPDSDLPARSPIRVGVFDPSGRAVDSDETTPSWLHPGRPGVVDIHVDGQPVRTVTAPVVANGRRIGTVVAARSLAAEATLLHRVRLLLLVGGIAAVAASMLAGWLLAGRALRPVRAGLRGPGGVRRGRLARAADAAHVRPAGGRGLGRRPDPALGRQVLGEMDYLSSLIDRLLQLARADDGSLHLSAGPVDVAAVCTAAARRARVARGVRIETGGQGRPIGDRGRAGRRGRARRRLRERGLPRRAERRTSGGGPTAHAS